MTYTLNQPIRYLGISTAAVLVAAFVLVQPMNAWSQEVVADVSLLNNCEPRLIEDPEDPIDMNTVLGTPTQGTYKDKEFAKTIHREKHYFSCEDANSPDITYIVEVAIFAEIIEKIEGKTITRMQAESITCLKDSDGFVIECQKRTPQTTSVPVSDCEEQFLAHPVEMNTVVSKNIVKTVDAEKEVFLCDFNKIVDVVIFTEIWEDMSRLPSNPVMKRDVVELRCTITTIFAIVETCIFNQFVPIVVPP
jgi:hypothetical protein